MAVGLKRILSCRVLNTDNANTKPKFRMPDVTIIQSSAVRNICFSFVMKRLEILRSGAKEPSE